VIQLSGGRGHLYVGYQLAAVLGPWSLQREGKTLGDYDVTGSARLLSFDSFWITRRATRIELHLGPTWWIWTGGIVHEVDLGILRLRILGDPDVVPEGRIAHVSRSR
jgi:hypothetical protein